MKTKDIIIHNLTPAQCKEKKHIYLRYTKSLVRPSIGVHRLKGTIVRYDLSRWFCTDYGFNYEESYLTEVTNVEKLLLDAGKMKYKEGL
jgi:hypothetical protein